MLSLVTSLYHLAHSLFFPFHLLLSSWFTHSVHPNRDHPCRTALLLLTRKLLLLPFSFSPDRIPQHIISQNCSVSETGHAEIIFLFRLFPYLSILSLSPSPLLCLRLLLPWPFFTWFWPVLIVLGPPPPWVKVPSRLAWTSQSGKSALTSAHHFPVSLTFHCQDLPSLKMGSTPGSPGSCFLLENVT